MKASCSNVTAADRRAPAGRRFIRLSLWGALLLGLTSGCGREARKLPPRRPRPVEVQTLARSLPPEAALASASVASWKTEEIGFEASGRIEFIVEPNTEIEGRIIDSDGNVLLAGTPIGRLESERYQLQVQRSEADVTQAEQNLKAGRTELEESIPAQIAAAQATRKLAKIEFERSKRLYEQNAGAESDVDRDRANYENAISQLKQLDAAESSQKAQMEVLQASLLQAKQNLRDAQRDLEDCTLYSSFRGVIADVYVVPGSVVSAGEPVATLQMMDPIKVEIEVSAEESRRLRRTEVLPVMVTQQNGSIDKLEGFLYLIDPFADPLTRTFTVTLLVMNRKVVSEVGDDITATTDQTWRLDFKFLPGAREGMLFVGEKAFFEDEDGYYAWMVTNADALGSTPKDGKLKVRKLRLKLGPLKVPYLGNWVFQQVYIEDDEFDPKKNVIIGRLDVLDGDPNDWNGDTVLLDTGGQWLMRPGDLVKVDLSGGDGVEGYYISMDAIVRVDGQPYIFVIEQQPDGTIARRLPVAMNEIGVKVRLSGLRRIFPVGDETLEGRQYITRGAHYLIDDEPVRVVTSEDAR
ncbi:MAG: HlyD family efflux transporter periplasmic adaptor subunit [Planctomycetota bacterium]